MFEILDDAIKNNLPLNTKIKYTCKNCGLEYVHKYSTIKNRKVNPNELICNNCLNNLYGYNLKVNLPYELKQLGDSPVPWNMYLKYKDKYNNGCRKMIQIECAKCKQTKLVQWRKIANRTYSKDMPICSDCIQKFKANLPEVRKINSEAQKIAQNREDVIKKRNNAVKISCNTKEMKLKRKYNAKKLWTIKEYRDKSWHSLKTLKGYYNGIKFDSSYELSVLIYYGDKIKRCDEIIPYFYNGEWHNYYPDYILNNDIILEIKGRYTDIVDIKKKYALEYIAKINYLKEYKVLYKEDLLKLEGFRLIDKNDLKNISNLEIKCLPKNWI